MKVTGRTDGVRFGLTQAVWWVLALGAALRVLFFFVSENSGGDAIARVAETEKWLEHPSLQLVFNVWPPLHFWLIGGIALLVRQVWLAGRLLSLFAGLLSLWVLGRLARELFGGTSATLSLLVFSLYSLHIGYCTTSSSDVPYLFFVLFGLLCFFRYRKGAGTLWLAAAGISLTLGAAIRYEAWVIILAVGPILLASVWAGPGREFRRRTNFRPLVVFGITAGAWPAFWMGYGWAAWGHPLYFVEMNRIWVPEQMAFGGQSIIYRMAALPGALLLSLSPVAVAAGLYGLWLAWRERTGREIAIITLVFGAVEFYQVISASLMPFARYTLTLGTLLALTSGYGLARLEERFFAARRVLFRTLAAGVLALNLAGILILSETRNLYSEKFASISPRLRYARYIEDVGNFLRPRLGASDGVVIDKYNVETIALNAVIGLPLQPGNRVFLTTLRKGSELVDYMKTQHPRYLIYSDRGELRTYLPLPHGCSIPPPLHGMRFECIHANDVYRIYEIRYD